MTTSFLPVLGGNALQSLNGTVNAFWVSHSLGVAAVTAISNANIIMMLMLGAVFGVSMAANILVAQSFGVTHSFLDGRLHEFGTTLLALAGLFNLLAVSDAIESRKVERG